MYIIVFDLNDLTFDYNSLIIWYDKFVGRECFPRLLQSKKKEEKTKKISFFIISLHYQFVIADRKLESIVWIVMDFITEKSVM